jgi:hypothetical protein
MGAAGRARMLADFTRGRMVDELLAWYRRLLQPGRA